MPIGEFITKLSSGGLPQPSSSRLEAETRTANNLSIHKDNSSGDRKPFGLYGSPLSPSFSANAREMTESNVKDMETEAFKTKQNHCAVETPGAQAFPRICIPKARSQQKAEGTVTQTLSPSLNMGNGRIKSGQNAELANRKSPTLSTIRNFLSGSSPRESAENNGNEDDDGNIPPWNVSGTKEYSKSNTSYSHGAKQSKSAEVLVDAPSMMMTNKSTSFRGPSNMSTAFRSKFHWMDRPYGFSRDSALRTACGDSYISRATFTDDSYSESAESRNGNEERTKSRKSSVSMFYDPFIEFQTGGRGKPATCFPNILGCLQGSKF